METEKVPVSHYTPYKGSGSKKEILFPILDGDRIYLPLGEEENKVAGGTGASDKEEGATLQVLHTPGHTSDHCCFLILQEKSLVTADHVLGQGTSVFDDLGSYLRSLKKCSKALEELGPSTQQEWCQSNLEKENENILYPSHGPCLESGRKTLKTYVSHRMERENQVLELLGKPSPENKINQENRTPSWSILEIVENLYSSYPTHLYPAAARGIFLHLHKLGTPDPDLKESVKIQCLNIPGYAKKDGGSGFPRMPNGESEWAEGMEVRFALNRQPQEQEGGRL